MKRKQIIILEMSFADLSELWLQCHRETNGTWMRPGDEERLKARQAAAAEPSNTSETSAKSQSDNTTFKVPVHNMQPTQNNIKDFFLVVVFLPAHKMTSKPQPIPVEVPRENEQSYEEAHVHKVYEDIASHFSETRYKVRVSCNLERDVGLIADRSRCRFPLPLALARR